MSEDVKKPMNTTEPLHMWRPNPGYQWNPMKRLPRNSPCLCGSGKKFKKCHLDTLPAVIPIPGYKQPTDATDQRA